MKTQITIENYNKVIGNHFELSEEFGKSFEMAVKSLNVILHKIQ